MARKPTSRPRLVNVSTKIPIAYRDALDELAQKDERTRSQMAARLLKEGLARLKPELRKGGPMKT